MSPVGARGHASDLPGRMEALRLDQALLATRCRAWWGLRGPGLRHVNLRSCF